MNDEWGHEENRDHTGPHIKFGLFLLRRHQPDEIEERPDGYTKEEDGAFAIDVGFGVLN